MWLLFFFISLVILCTYDTPVLFPSSLFQTVSPCAISIIPRKTLITFQKHRYFTVYVICSYRCLIPWEPLSEISIPRWQFSSVILVDLGGKYTSFMNSEGEVHQFPIVLGYLLSGKGKKKKRELHRRSKNLMGGRTGNQWVTRLGSNICRRTKPR